MQTARDRVKQRWDSYGKPYFQRNKTYYSTFVLKGRVVNAVTTNDANMAYVVFDGGQKMPWFSYGESQQAKLGPALREATQADTNLGQANKTDGSTDFVIEGIGIGVRDCRIVYPQAQIDLIVATPVEAVQAALEGNAPLVDPASLVTPPQFGSPFNTEVPFWHGLSGLVAVTLNFDNGRDTFELGCANMFPDASANSQMRASGMPLAGNAYPLPDGFQWNAEGNKEGQTSLTLMGQLAEDVVVPVNLAVRPTLDTVAVQPTEVYVSVRAALYGQEFEAQNDNG